MGIQSTNLYEEARLRLPLTHHHMQNSPTAATTSAKTDQAYLATHFTSSDSSSASLYYNEVAGSPNCAAMLFYPPVAVDNMIRHSGIPRHHGDVSGRVSVASNAAATVVYSGPITSQDLTSPPHHTSYLWPLTYHYPAHHPHHTPPPPPQNNSYVYIGTQHTVAPSTVGFGSTVTIEDAKLLQEMLLDMPVQSLNSRIPDPITTKLDKPETEAILASRATKKRHRQSAQEQTVLPRHSLLPDEVCTDDLPLPIALSPKKKRLPTSRMCRAPGCTKGIRSRGLCKAHGGGRRCTTPGCEISDQGGGHCIAHGGGRRCSVSGCHKSAQSKGRCKVHGGARRCRLPDCQKNGQIKGLCRLHYTLTLAEKGMVV